MFKKRKKISSVNILLTNQCNKNCSFCFQRNIGSGIKKLSERDITLFIDWVLKEKNSSKKLWVNFMGGEPLIKFELIKKIIDKYKNILFSLNTNGLLLNKESINYFNKKKILVTISIQEKNEQIFDVIKNLRPKSLSFNLVVTPKKSKKLFSNFVYIYKNYPNKIYILPTRGSKWTKLGCVTYANQFIKCILYEIKEKGSALDVVERYITNEGPLCGFNGDLVLSYDKNIYIGLENSIYGKSVPQSIMGSIKGNKLCIKKRFVDCCTNTDDCGICKKIILSSQLAGKSKFNNLMLKINEKLVKRVIKNEKHL